MGLDGTVGKALLYDIVCRCKRWYCKAEVCYTVSKEDAAKG